MSRPPLKLALLGAVHVHAPSYLSFYQHQRAAAPSAASVVAVAESNEGRVAELKKAFPEVSGWYATPEELFDKETVDGVIICGTNADHDKMATVAISRGIAVLCEKPLTLCADSSARLVRYAHEKGVPLLTAFPVRFSDAAEVARKEIASGSIGELMSIVSTNHGTMPGGWFVDPALSGGGAVFDHTVHVVDLLRWMLDDEFSDVTCHAATRRFDLRVEDSGLLMLTTRRGVAVTLDTSWSRPKSYDTWGNVNLRFQGTRGALTLQCFPRQTRTFMDAPYGVAASSAVEDMNADMLRHFEAVIAGEESVIPSGEDGLRAVEIALAAYASLQSNRTETITLTSVAVS
jgi:myo-inositol 2-dehydrogenase/D-chiro-inositol 1-dehydrogenase